MIYCFGPVFTKIPVLVFWYPIYHAYKVWDLLVDLLKRYGTKPHWEALFCCSSDLNWFTKLNFWNVVSKVLLKRVHTKSLSLKYWTIFLHPRCPYELVKEITLGVYTVYTIHMCIHYNYAKAGCHYKWPETPRNGKTFLRPLLHEWAGL